MKLKSIALTGLAVLLVRCAGGPPASVLPGISAPAVDGRTHRARVRFMIKVPRAGHRPHYVSPSTHSISIVIDAGTAQQVTIAKNLASGETTLSLNLTAGAHSFNIATYDGALSGGVPTGHLLSVENDLPFTVKLGKDNLVGATLQGVPTSIVVAPVQNQDVTGDQINGFNFVGKYKADGTTLFTRSFTIATQDADGNFIVGAGSPQITAVSANATVVSNGAGSNTSFAFSPGSNANFPATTSISITATPGAGAGAALHASVPITVTCLTAPRIYIWDSNQGKMLAYDESGNAVSLPGSAFSSLSGVTSIIYDAHDDLIYLSDGTIVYAYDHSGNLRHSVVPAGSYLISALAYGNGLIYAATADVTNGGVLTFNESLGQVSTSGPWLESGSGKLPALPAAIIVDTGGNVDLLDAATTQLGVWQFSSQGAATGVSWEPVHDGMFADMVQDPVTGFIYVTDSSSNLQVFEPSGLVESVSGSFPGLTHGEGLAWDPTSRRLYACDTAADKIFAYDGEGNAIALSGTFPGLVVGSYLTIVQ